MATADAQPAGDQALAVADHQAAQDPAQAVRQRAHERRPIQPSRSPHVGLLLLGRGQGGDDSVHGPVVEGEVVPGLGKLRQTDDMDVM